jgi:predicted lipoprotein with Yx(FWY)xxD motif
MLVVLPTRLVLIARLVVTVAVLAVLAVACAAPPAPEPAPLPVAAAAGEAHGGGHDGAPAGGAPAGGHGHGSGAGLYAVQSGPLGVVTTDPEGRLVYMNTGDTPTSSSCTGACAEEWLPVLLPEGVEPELLGIDPGLVGLLPRPEGVQLTLGGHPLYHRADDLGGLPDAARHGEDGVWFAIDPYGEQIA